MNAGRRLRIGVVGLGGMGSQHARNLLEGKVYRAELAAVSDQRPASAEAFPETPFFATAEEMFDSGKVEAVLVATPHFSHPDLGVLALERGLHLLMEKPLCVHKAECERLLSAHTREDLVFAAMFNQRVLPSYRRLKEMIEGGELGRIMRINWIITDWFRSEYYYRSGDWRATWAGEGGGVLLNQCPHQLDMWQWFFGMPREVRAQCSLGRYHDIEVEDDVTAVLLYDGGVTGVFVASTGEAPGTNRLEIVCDRGKVVAENGGLLWHRTEQGVAEFTRESGSAFGKPAVELVELDCEDGVNGHVGIMSNFAAAILEGAPLIAPAVEGIRSVELGNAMLYSALKDEVVSMPLDSSKYSDLLNGLMARSRYKRS